MRDKLYCHSVHSADDGRLIIHISDQQKGERDPSIEILINAPFEAFDKDEVPRAWHHYRVRIERVEE